MNRGIGGRGPLPPVQTPDRRASRRPLAASDERNAMSQGPHARAIGDLQSVRPDPQASEARCEAAERAVRAAIDDLIPKATRVVGRESRNVRRGRRPGTTAPGTGRHAARLPRCLTAGEKTPRTPEAGIRGAGDQSPGWMTVSITWITPFEASMSAWTTVAPSTITPSSRLMVISEPSTVSAIMPSDRSVDITLPGTTW